MLRDGNKGRRSEEGEALRPAERLEESWRQETEGGVKFDFPFWISVCKEIRVKYTS